MNLGRSAQEIFECNTGLLLKWSVVNGMLYEAELSNLLEIISLSRSFLLEYDILDCIAIINFCEAPPSFKMKKFSDYIRTNEGRALCSKDGTKTRIDSNLANGDMTVVVISLAAGDARAGLSCMLMTFEGKSLLAGSWPAAQEMMRREMLENGWRRGHPYLLE